MSIYYICSHCNSTNTTLKGKSSTGSPVYLCNVCKRKSSLYRIRDEFDMGKLPALLIKLHSQLTNKELYTLGILIGRGNLTGRGHLYIDLPRNKADILLLISELLCIKPPFKIRSNFTRLSYYNQYSVMFWNNLGLYQYKQYNTWLPYMNNSHFIRGLCEASGVESNKGIIYRIKSNYVLQGLKTYIERTLGIHSSTIPWSYISKWYDHLYSKCGDMKIDSVYSLIYKAHPTALNSK